MNTSQNPGGSHNRVQSQTYVVISTLIAAILILSSCLPVSKWPVTRDPGPIPPMRPLPLPQAQQGAVIAALTGKDGKHPDSNPSSLDALIPTVTPTLQPSLTPTPEPTPESIEPLSLEQVADCLSSGEVLYALALQNTNVRQAPSVDACRVGRIPKGSLIRLTGVIAENQPQAMPTAPPIPTIPARATASAATAASTASPATPTSPQLGYVEDVQPIFLRACIICHSAVAQNKGLMVTTYAGVMKGSTSGAVVIPGDPDASILWQMLGSRKMPLMGALTDAELETIRAWIEAGAPETRPVRPTAIPAPTRSAPTPTPMQTAQQLTTATNQPQTGPITEFEEIVNALTGKNVWLKVVSEDYDTVGDVCSATSIPLTLISSDLVLPVACAKPPQLAPLNDLRAMYSLPLVDGSTVAASITANGGVTGSATISGSVPLSPSISASASSTQSTTSTTAIAPTPVPQFRTMASGSTGISAPVFGLPAPADSDGWLTPRIGLCVERYLPNNTRGITALTFASDGRLFLALDSNLAGEIDPLILYDAYHPSRSVAVMVPGDKEYTELLTESPRITGLDWHDGALYLSRSGEVGRIPDSGKYEKLAGGFAVTSQLFHSNNGIVIHDGWVYVSAGGVIDGYSDGPLVGIGEDAAQLLASGGNPWAARIVRAPLDALITDRSINDFTTAARGTRNPYGITVDPSGNIWFTDNGATNLPDNISAGDEVNILNPGTIGGSEGATPYYGFPLALVQTADWYTPPVITLQNAAAPTGIVWALGTIYFAQYGKNPGLYRIGVDGSGKLAAERIMLGWPILSLTTAPDGALWMGMGDGGLYRITSGCG